MITDSAFPARDLGWALGCQTNSLSAHFGLGSLDLRCSGLDRTLPESSGIGCTVNSHFTSHSPSLSLEPVSFGSLEEWGEQDLGQDPWIPGQIIFTRAPTSPPFYISWVPPQTPAQGPVVIFGGWLEGVSHPWVLAQGRWQCQLSFPSSYFVRSLSSDADHLWGQSDRWGESTTSKSGPKVSTCFVIRPHGVGLNQDGFGALQSKT